jgi:uncharacterized membrane protein (DUF441 family)
MSFSFFQSYSCHEFTPIPLSIGYQRISIATAVMAPLTTAQIQACAIAERVASSVSITGTLMMFVAFFCFPRYRTLLSNRLLICASFANLMCDAAALMGGSGLAHLNSSLCQAQAFLLEW